MDKVYRATFRNGLLCTAFGAGTAIFAAAAVLPDTPVAYRAGFAALAALMAVVAVRCARMRLVAEQDGLRMYGPLINQFVRWDAMRQIVGTDTETDGNLLPVRAPVIVLTNGRRLKARAASSYGLRNTAADRTATELETLRRSRTR